MVMSKEELIAALKDEIRVLLHLVSKVDAQQLDYRPSPKQRSTLELLRYLTIVGPIHIQVASDGFFDITRGQELWGKQQALANERDFEATRKAIEDLPQMFTTAIQAMSDEQLREPIELFGQKASRGFWLVRLVLSHYTAYRMQLFLYLKGSGREELNTMNLWAGIDAPMTPPS